MPFKALNAFVQIMEIWSGLTGPQGHTHEQQKIELLNFSNNLKFKV